MTGWGDLAIAMRACRLKTYIAACTAHPQSHPRAPARPPHPAALRTSTLPLQGREGERASGFWLAGAGGLGGPVGDMVRPVAEAQLVFEAADPAPHRNAGLVDGF